MTMTDDDTRSAERAAVEQLVDAGLLDELMDRVMPAIFGSPGRAASCPR